MKMFKYYLVIPALALIIVISLRWFQSPNYNYVPQMLHDTGLSLPISASEQSLGVIAKIEFNKAQVNDILDWYGKRGFKMVADSSQTNGYGPHGVSFSICSTNQAMMLVITQWKDL